MSKNIEKTLLFNDKGKIPVGVFDFDGNIIYPNSTLKFWNNEIKDYEYVGVIDFDEDPDYYINSEKYDFPKYFASHFENLRDFSYYNNDHKGPDILIHDSLKAIEEGRLSPSIEYFKNEFLLLGRPAAILTARGHGSGNLERVVRELNNHLLTEEEKVIQIENIRKNFGLEHFKKREVLDYYFQFVFSYISCSNVHDTKMFLLKKDLSIEVKKTILLERYLKEIIPFIFSDRTGLTKKQAKNQIYSVGYSDDSYKNICEMISYFGTKIYKKTFPKNFQMHFVYTGKEKNLTKIQKTIDEIKPKITCSLEETTQGGATVWKIKFKNIY